MREAGDKMKKAQEDEEKKELEVDVQALREILENLVELSKNQEDLMERFKTVNGYNPQFVQMGQAQKRIKDDAKHIEDSLTALSKRVAEIKSFINREMTKMNDHLDKANKGFATRNFGQTRVDQQYAMTGMNNLALMLSEVLQQMQMEMTGQQDGKKSGKMKGKGKGSGNKKAPGMSELKKMQEELNKQLREGLNKGGKAPGGKSGLPSEQMARMAAQQMAIRQQLDKMMQEMGGKNGKQGAGQLGEMKKLMEETEKELFNKRLSNELLMRQEQILTRLLESEKAEKKQEQDVKREAEQSKEKERPSPPDFNKYIQQKNRETELLKTVPAEMQPYYKEKVKQYLNSVE
jgi:hypothetical protein